MNALEKFIPLIEFMGVVFGKNFEIILHDVSKPNSSVIAIQNGHITGRNIGGPMTDLAIKMMNQKDYHSKNFIANYEGRTKDGRILVSSTYYIKEDKKLIGMICVNHDVCDILEAEKIVNRLKEAFGLLNPEEHKPEYLENLDDSIVDYSNNLIHNTLSNLQITPQRMSANERVSVIRQLDTHGVFSTKGSIPQLAKYFGVSESTIYRYVTRARDINHNK